MSIFGAVVGGIFNAILGGIGASAEAKTKSALTKEQIIAAGEQDRLSLGVKGTEDRKSLGYAADIDWYYKKLEEDNKRQGANNYAQFNSLERFAPQYKSTYTAPPLPTKPTP